MKAAAHASVIALVSLSVVHCHRKTSEDIPPPEETYGCVMTGMDKPSGCQELDATPDAAERAAFAAKCASLTLRIATGRQTRHCPTEGIVAQCRFPSDKITWRYYAESTTEQMRGFRISCSSRGGVWSDAP